MLGTRSGAVGTGVDRRDTDVLATGVLVDGGPVRQPDALRQVREYSREHRS